MNKTKSTIYRGLLVGCAFIAYPAFAQQPTSGAAQQEQPSGNSNDTGSVGEIIVTAQRRSQNLQDVPLAVTAVTGETIQNLGLKNIVDIGAVTPGASFQNAVGFFQAYIRGIGTTVTSVGVEAPVAIYEDGAYLVRTLNVRESLDNFDVGSVQVLRGPQGTLYGRNATGGVILINSADPTDKFEGRARGEFGNIEHRQLDAVLNLPLAEDLALRVSGGYRHEGGYVKNIAVGRDVGGGRAYNARAKLRWQPGSADIILGVQYQNTRFFLDTPTADTDSPINYASTIAGVKATTGDFFKQNKNFVTAPITGRYFGANLNMKFEVGDFELSSVTTYRKQKIRNSISDQDYSPADIFNFAVPKSGGATFSQDFQVTSRLDGPFNYVFGLTYLHDKAIFNPVFSGAFFAGPVPTFGEFPAFANTAKTNSYSAFVEGYYDVTDQLKVTLGGRYTYENRKLSGTTNAAFASLFSLPGFSFEENANQRAFTPRFVVAWDGGTTNVYYSFTRGFKAGGFAGPAVFPVAEIQPEKIFSHEVGIKQRALGGKASINLAAFYFKNKNLQTQTNDLNNGGTVTQNAGALENYGLELETQFAPVEGLTLSLSGAWQHARYKPYRMAAITRFDPTGTLNPTAPGAFLYAGTTDLTGTVPPQAPTWSGAFSTSYEFALGDWTGALTSLTQYRSSVEFFPGAGGDLRHDRDGERVLVNVSGYISPPGEALRLGFYANNLFDKKYRVNASTAQPYGTYYEAGMPRTYGVRVEYRF